MDDLKRPDGFTLIELIVVLALISLVLFISVPRLQNTLADDPAARTSRRLIQQIRTLKNRAVRNQKTYILNVDIDADRIWVTESAPAQETDSAPDTKAFQLPSPLDITAVVLPRQGTLSSGQAQIRFYRRGYSDKALIHIENRQGHQQAFLIEAFLNRVRLYDHHAGFEI